MNILTKLSDLLYRGQRALGIIAIFLFLSVVSFRFDRTSIKLLSSDSPFIALFLVFIIFLIALIWIKIEKQKTQLLIKEIQNSAAGKYSIVEEKLNALSGRQREVFNLIIQGKSNKEIISALNIELSTLKTHINQIYKALDIRSRKEAHSLGKVLKKEV